MLTEPEQYAQAALIAVNEGYDAIKVDTVAMDRHGNWNQQNLNGPLTDKILRLGYDRMAAIRDAVGPDVISSPKCTPLRILHPQFSLVA